MLTENVQGADIVSGSAIFCEWRRRIRQAGLVDVSLRMVSASHAFDRGAL